MNLKKLYPFESHFHKLKKPSACRMHYIDEGKGEPIVMLHGNPTWSFYFRDLIKFLSPMYRCLAPDHIGCGLSDKPQKYTYNLEQHIENTLDWLKSLNIGHFHLIVHDWGGAIGMGIATRWPASIQSITVLNSAAFLCKKIPLRIALCRFPFIGPFAIKHLNIFVRAATWMATAQGLSNNVKEGYLFPYNNAQNRIAINAFVQDIPMEDSHPSYKVLEHIENNLWLIEQKPCLLAWGMKDFCFTPEFLSKWHNFFPGAQIQCYEGAGHYVLEDAGEDIFIDIRRFLLKNPIQNYC